MCSYYTLFGLLVLTPVAAAEVCFFVPGGYIYTYIYFFLAGAEVQSNGNHVAHMNPASKQQHGKVLHIVAAAQHAALQDVDVIWQPS